METHQEALNGFMVELHGWGRRETAKAPIEQQRYRAAHHPQFFFQAVPHTVSPRGAGPPA